MFVVASARIWHSHKIILIQLIEHEFFNISDALKTSVD